MKSVVTAVSQKALSSCILHSQLQQQNSAECPIDKHIHQVFKDTIWLAVNEKAELRFPHTTENFLAA